MVDLSHFLGFNLRAVMKKMDKALAARLEPYGISITQAFILNALLIKNGATLKEVGIMTQIDSSSMTVLVDKLENDGLVERKLDSQDRRAIRVFITEKGEGVAVTAKRIYLDFNAYLYDILGESHQKEFMHGLNNLMNELE